MEKRAIDTIGLLVVAWIGIGAADAWTAGIWLAYESVVWIVARRMSS